MKKIILFLLAVALLLTACAAPPPEPTEVPTTAPTQPPVPKVGISMPSSHRRWDQESAWMQADLEALGYDVELAFAEDDVEKQSAQLEEMIAHGCKLLIVTTIEISNYLDDILSRAREAGITVIAYYRTIFTMQDCDYYIEFDRECIGRLQAQYIADALDLENADGPFNLELVQGGVYDSRIYWESAMEVLEPYLNSGKLVVPSGQIDWLDCYTDDWETSEAQARMEQILAEYYQDQPLHAVLCANDSTARGAALALEACYTGSYPVITGMDCEIASVKNIIDGKQAMSVFKDTPLLCRQTVKLADSILRGEEPEVNGKWYNGEIDIPTYWCEPAVVTAENYEYYLIDSGYYQRSDLE